MTDELRHFLLVCQHGTFTEAARKAFLSQPALSASIKRLEEALGGKLLDRGPQGATPTAAGLALKPWAESALGAIEQGRRAVAAVEGLDAGEVRIGAGATACSYLLPEGLTRFRAQYPAIGLYLRECPSTEVLRRVESGDLDLGIVSTDQTASASVEVWRTDPLVLVASPALDPSDAPHLTFPTGANHRELLERHFPDARIAMELTSLVAIKAHVVAGMGVALVSHRAVERELSDGSLVAVPDPRTPEARTLYVIHHGERASPAAAALRLALIES